MNAKVTVVADPRDACGEGPMWDSRSGRIYWVDIIAASLHTCDWPGTSVHTFRPGVPVSGLAFTESQSLVLAGSDGVWLWQDQTALTPIARELNGEPLAINDCIADERGRLLAGSTFFDGSVSYPLGSLYCVDTDGAVRVLDTGFKLANGMGFSVDRKTLYVTDSGERRIYAYDYDARTGNAAHRRVLVQVPSEEGLPDGLTVDAQGFIWSAQWFGGCLFRYDPDGRIERRIRIPAEQTSSLTFGGPDLTDIFVSSAATLDALVLAPRAYRSTGNVGGQLFHLNLGIQGKAEFRARIQSVSEDNSNEQSQP